MKDYTFTGKSQKDFVRGFRKNGDFIEVLMADGTIRGVIDDKTNRRGLDELMREQIYNVRPNLYKISMGLSSLVALTSTYSLATLKTDNLMATGLLALSVGLSGYLIKREYETIKDIDKHIYFLEMEDDIIRNDLEGANIFNDVSPISKELIAENGFSLNIVEAIPDDDLVTIDTNLESKILVKRMRENEKLKNK